MAVRPACVVLPLMRIVPYSGQRAKPLQRADWLCTKVSLSHSKHESIPDIYVLFCPEYSFSSSFWLCTAKSTGISDDEGSYQPLTMVLRHGFALNARRGKREPRAFPARRILPIPPAESPLVTKALSQALRPTPLVIISRFLMGSPLQAEEQ